MVRRIVEGVVRDHDERSLTGLVAPVADVDGLVGELVARVAGFGPLQPFLDDPTVEEVWINDPSRVFIARNGRHELTNLMLSAAQVQELVERMLKSSGLEFLDHQPCIPPSRAGLATRKNFQASGDRQVAVARTGQEGCDEAGSRGRNAPLMVKEFEPAGLQRPLHKLLHLRGGQHRLVGCAALAGDEHLAGVVHADLLHRRVVEVRLQRPEPGHPRHQLTDQPIHVAHRGDHAGQAPLVVIAYDALDDPAYQTPRRAAGSTPSPRTSPPHLPVEAVRPEPVVRRARVR